MLHENPTIHFLFLFGKLDEYVYFSINIMNSIYFILFV